MNHRARVATCISALALAGLCGCAPRTVADSYGRATREVAARQIQNPESAESRIPVDGLGATTAAEVIQNYHENQKTAAQERRQERQRDNGLVDID